MNLLSSISMELVAAWHDRDSVPRPPCPRGCQRLRFGGTLGIILDFCFQVGGVHSGLCASAYTSPATAHARPTPGCGQTTKETLVDSSCLPSNPRSNPHPTLQTRDQNTALPVFLVSTLHTLEHWHFE